MTELPDIGAKAGDGGSRITSHAVSTRFVITNHETSKSRTSRLYLRRDTVPGQVLLRLEDWLGADGYSGSDGDTVRTISIEWPL
jgi:hypothetical protein